MEDININGLMDKESEMIAESFSRGVTSGLMGTGLKWEIVHEGLDGMDELHVFNQLYDGFTSGYYPNWELKFERI